MRIKPGLLCIIVGTGHPEYDGRLVTTIRYLGRFERPFPVGIERCGFLWLRQRVVCDVAVVADAWLVGARSMDGELVVQAHCLRPIVDPDADLSEPAADPLHICPACGAESTAYGADYQFDAA